jgi:membrane-anchored glycerophosphoryl diester phosphodiesterase (GDPDase)
MEIKSLLHDKQHLIFIILLFVLIAIVFFKMAFLNYIPEHSLNNEIEKLGNLIK